MQRLGWLVYDQEEIERNQAYIDQYHKSALQHGVELRLMISNDLETGIRDGKPWIGYQNQRCDLPDFVIMRAIHPFLSHHMEAMLLPVFNSAAISELCLDKRRSFHAAARVNWPIMPTRFYTNGLPTWQEASALFAGNRPFVIKPADGRGGRQVLLIETPAQYERACAAVQPDRPMLIQQASSELGRDLRVYVIGRHIEAAMLRISDPSRDFRSNFSLGGEAAPYNLSHPEKAMIMRLVERLEFGLVGIDFLFDEGRLVFNEMEDVVGARMLYTHTDINIADRYLDYILKQLDRRWLPGS